MSREINFLNERRKRLTRVEREDQKWIRATLAIFGVTFIFFLCISGVRLYLDRQHRQIKEAQRVLRDQVANNVEVERSLVIMVHKLSSLANIDRDRAERRAAIGYFSDIFGANVFIKDVKFNQKEKLLLIRLESKNIFRLREIFQVVSNDEVRQKFTSVKPSDLVRNDAGQYEMTLAVVTKSVSLQ